MAPQLERSNRVADLEDCFLAMLLTKRPRMFPLALNEDDSAALGRDKGRYLARKKIIDRVVPPMYPSQPLAALYANTRVALADYYDAGAKMPMSITPFLPVRMECLDKTTTGAYYWFGYRRRSRSGLRQLWTPASRLAPVPLELHTRKIFPDGREIYEKELVAVCSGTSVAPYLLDDYQEPWEDFLEWQVEQFTDIATMAYYTHHIQQFWHMAWSYAGKTVVIPATEGAVKALALLREGPRTTASGRRNPLLHWVTEHLREISPGRLIPVTEHLRGTDRFVMGEYAAEIRNPVQAA